MADNRLRQYRERIGTQKQIIATQSAENNKLRQELEALRCQLDKSNSDTDTDEEHDAPSYAHWHEADRVYRCSGCATEVVDGVCQGCGEEYDSDDEEHPEDSISTQSLALDPDRTSHERGTTPLLDPGVYLVPKEYRGREDEYRALLERGATRLMCETFHLEFRTDVGIIAWADTDLFAEFSGPGMLKHDTWCIRLGRRVVLDEEDLDGACFIQDLLEDALLFPLRSAISDKVAERWHTVQLSQLSCTWETRLMVDPNDQNAPVSEDVVQSDESADSDKENAFYDPTQYPDLLPSSKERERLIQMEDEALEDEGGKSGDVVIQQAGYEEGEDSESSDEATVDWDMPDAVWEEDTEMSQSEDSDSSSGVDMTTEDGDDSSSEGSESHSEA
ncbi:hypothetical protein HGRIS_008912 [Hohenbuehelia grisea]|uniref:DUF8191 domain-containing protein n=1 Tax=Hohenbuehelia grisea TaxID=104357 RepID=A0ABR3IZY6_9AGAR